MSALTIKRMLALHNLLGDITMKFMFYDLKTTKHPLHLAKDDSACQLSVKSKTLCLSWDSCNVNHRT